MKDLWNYFKNLFHAAEASTPSQPFLHEVIQRQPEELAAFQTWKESLVCRRLVDWLDGQYALWFTLPDEVEDAIDFLETPSSKGFVIHFHKTEYSRQDATYFLDYLKEKVLVLHYRVHVSDTRTFTKNDGVETSERHYLKPRTTFAPGSKSNQRFGNVTIELLLRNDFPYQLKFQATTYSDHLFSQAEDFKNLMQALLER